MINKPANMQPSKVSQLSNIILMTDEKLHSVDFRSVRFPAGKL